MFCTWVEKHCDRVNRLKKGVKGSYNVAALRIVQGLSLPMRSNPDFTFEHSFHPQFSLIPKPHHHVTSLNCLYLLPIIKLIFYCYVQLIHSFSPCCLSTCCSVWNSACNLMDFSVVFRNPYASESFRLLPSPLLHIAFVMSLPKRKKMVLFM